MHQGGKGYSVPEGVESDASGNDDEKRIYEEIQRLVSASLEAEPQQRDELMQQAAVLQEELARRMEMCGGLEESRSTDEMIQPVEECFADFEKK